MNDKEEPESICNIALWDEDGYNQWGTKYVSAKKCPNGHGEIPSNMYGMGNCPTCGEYVDPNKTR